MLGTPWILKLAIDGLKEDIPSNRLITLAAAFAGITVLSGIFRFLMRRIMIGVSRKIELKRSYCVLMGVSFGFQIQRDDLAYEKPVPIS